MKKKENKKPDIKHQTYSLRTLQLHLRIAVANGDLMHLKACQKVYFLVSIRIVPFPFAAILILNKTLVYKIRNAFTSVHV